MFNFQTMYNHIISSMKTVSQKNLILNLTQQFYENQLIVGLYMCGVSWCMEADFLPPFQYCAYKRSVLF